MACVGWCNNQDCSNNIASCSNSYSFTTISIGDLVRASHVSELITAVNLAYTRLGGGPSGLTAPSISDDIDSSDWTDLKTHINILYQSGWSSDVITLNYTAGLDITKVRTDHLQDGVNDCLTLCKCDYNCTCNINCGCNVDCTCNYSDERLKEEWVYL